MKLSKKREHIELTVQGFSCSCGCGSSACRCACSVDAYQQYSNGRIDSAETYENYVVRRDMNSTSTMLSN